MMRGAISKWFRNLIILWEVFNTEQRSKILYNLSNACLMPIALIYLALRLFSGDKSAIMTWTMGSLMFSVAAGSLMQVGFGSLEDRLLGRSALLRTMNVGKSEYLASQLGAALVSALLLIVVGLLILMALQIFPWDVRRAFLVLMVGIAVSLLFAACGALIGTNAGSFERAGALLVAVSTGGAFLAPVFYSAAALPWWLQQPLRMYPLALASQIARNVGLGGSESAFELLFLAGSTVGLGLVAARWTRWKA
jgi:ABC-type polysaccharide/polyol phosphate export permease